MKELNRGYDKEFNPNLVLQDVRGKLTSNLNIMQQNK
jgi:hypothetical protein